MTSVIRLKTRLLTINIYKMYIYFRKYMMNFTKPFYICLLISLSLACNQKADPSVDPLNPLNSGGPDSKSMKCDGKLTSSCEGTACTVSCSDGTVEELVCEKQLVNTRQEGEDVHYKCGEDPPECFPFCSGTGVDIDLE